MVRGCLLLLAVLLMGGHAQAAEVGETRCGAAGTVERYSCLSTGCRWDNTYQRCANTNRAPTCNVGDTKCGATGYVQRCEQYSGDPFWQATFQRCAVDRDPADNAPAGYGGYNTRPAPSPGYSNGYSAGSTAPAACTLGTTECGSDRRTQRCVVRGGRAVWQTEAGSRCGGGNNPSVRY